MTFERESTYRPHRFLQRKCGAAGIKKIILRSLMLFRATLFCVYSDKHTGLLCASLSFCLSLSFLFQRCDPCGRHHSGHWLGPVCNRGQLVCWYAPVQPHHHGGKHSDARTRERNYLLPGFYELNHSRKAYFYLLLNLPHLAPNC